MAERIVNLSPVHNILVSDNAFSGDWTTECPSVYLTSLVFSILEMLPSERVRNLASSGIESEFIGFEASGLDHPRDTSRKISTAVRCDRDNNYEAEEEHNWTARPNG